MLFRLVSYMNSTVDFGVQASACGTLEAISLHLYTDAGLGGDICTMKSHSGIYLVVECPKSSRRQQCVPKSTTESELVAMNEGLYSDAMPVQTVLGLVFGLPILILHEDNQACIHILCSGYSPKLKSMNRTHKLSIAGIHETINDLGLELWYTESADQLADLFTKVFPRIYSIFTPGIYIFLPISSCWLGFCSSTGHECLLLLVSAQRADRKGVYGIR